MDILSPGAVAFVAADRSQVWQWLHNDARALFEQVALADEFVDFLTIPAYRLVD